MGCIDSLAECDLIVVCDSCCSLVVTSTLLVICVSQIVWGASTRTVSPPCDLVGLCADSHQVFCKLLNVVARSMTIPVFGGYNYEAAIEARLP